MGGGCLLIEPEELEPPIKRFHCQIHMVRSVPLLIARNPIAARDKRKGRDNRDSGKAKTYKIHRKVLGQVELIAWGVFDVR